MISRRLLREITPPVLLRLLLLARSRIGRAETRPPEWEYIPEGWAYARTHPEVRGWDVPEILEVYRRKWPRFRELVEGAGPLGVAHESDLSGNTDLVSHNEIMTFGYVLGLAAGGRDTASVLDWGGGVGHYYLLARALHPRLALEYHCRDVASLAALGAELLPEAHFYADDSCLARTYDLVMASTSLHYAQDWQPALAGLARAAGRYLYVTGLPVVTSAASYVFIQRPYSYGYNTEYLGWCLNRREFLQCAAGQALELVREFVVGLRQPIQGAPEPCEYRGYLFRPARGER